MDLPYIVFAFAILSCVCHAALWSPAWKELTSWFSCILYFLCICHFPIRYPRSGVVLDCIGSRSLPPSLLCIAYTCQTHETLVSRVAQW